MSYNFEASGAASASACSGSQTTEECANDPDQPPGLRHRRRHHGPRDRAGRPRGRAPCQPRRPRLRPTRAGRDEIARRLERRHPDIAATLDDRLSTFGRSTQAPADPDTVVVEAVLEDLAVKARVFSQAEKHFGDACILATNTSSLSVTEIAAQLRHPVTRGGHALLQPGPRSCGWSRSSLASRPTQRSPTPSPSLATSWGKDVARVQSAPGFIVNRVARAFYGEALRLVEEQAASPADPRRGAPVRGRLQDGSLRADGPDRQRRQRIRHTDGVDRLQLRPRFNPSRIQDELVVGRPVRTQVRPWLLRLQRCCRSPTRSHRHTGNAAHDRRAPRLLRPARIHP